MMNKIANRYKKPTPPKWRKRGDWILLIGLILDASIIFIDTIAEDGIAEPKTIHIITASITFISTIYKFWTNTKDTE